MRSFKKNRAGDMSDDEKLAYDKHGQIMSETAKINRARKALAESMGPDVVKLYNLTTAVETKIEQIRKIVGDENVMYTLKSPKFNALLIQYDKAVKREKKGDALRTKVNKIHHDSPGVNAVLDKVLQEVKKI